MYKILIIYINWYWRKKWKKKYIHTACISSSIKTHTEIKQKIVNNNYNMFSQKCNDMDNIDIEEIGYWDYL